MKALTQIAPPRAEKLGGLWHLLAGLAFCGLAACGCHSISKSSSGASVRIGGNTPGQIRDVAVDVFGKDGYNATKSSLTNIVFEKEASSMANIAYGGWGQTPLWIRVKCSIVPAGDQAFRLQAAAFRVHDKGGPIEEEDRYYGFETGSIQKLLDEVASRLGEKPGG